MWGTNRSLDAPKDSSVKDEDLQAQAWLPNCLMVMLEEVRTDALLCSISLAFQLLIFTLRVLHLRGQVVHFW